MSQPRLIGELAVVALEAENLPKVAGNLKTFCVFKVANVAKRTKTDPRGNRNPTWDDQVNMPIPHGYNVMSVQVMNEDPKGDQIICEGQIDLNKVLKEGESDDWVSLKQRNGKEGGDVYLELTFYSANPPPRRQPTRFGHPRPPHMAGGVSFARPPMPNQFPARPRPPMHSASAPVAHPSATPHPPPSGGPYTGPPPHHVQPGGFAPAPPGPHGARPPPMNMPPQPMGMPPQPMGTPTHPVAATQVGPPASMPPSSSVSVGNQWRASTVKAPYSNSPQPRPMPPQGSPNQPMGAPLLSSPYRPGGPPSRPPSYNNGGYSPASHPSKPLPNYPPEHFGQGPPPQFPTPQHNYPPAGGYPPVGGPPHPHQGPPPSHPGQGYPSHPGQGYPPQPGYPPY